MFQGFSQETFDFIWGIRFNNDKTWFEAHKAQYQEHLLLPMRELAAHCQAEVNRDKPDPKLNLHISRIYRDARRLFGRGPFKDHMWFSLFPWDKDNAQVRPSLWFEIGPEGWNYGMGFWEARAEIMAKFRARMDRDPKPMLALDRKLQKQQEFTLDGQSFKRSKTPPDPRLLQWYNFRSFVLIHEEPPDEILYSPALADRLVEGFRFLLPYMDYFSTLWADPDPNEP